MQLRRSRGLVREVGERVVGGLDLDGAGDGGGLRGGLGSFVLSRRLGFACGRERQEGDGQRKQEEGDGLHGADAIVLEEYAQVRVDSCWFLVLGSWFLVLGY